MLPSITQATHVVLRPRKELPGISDTDRRDKVQSMNLRQMASCSLHRTARSREDQSMKSDSTRRELLRNGALVLSTSTLGSLCTSAWAQTGKESKEPEVTATEDLMREHGVIRRALWCTPNLQRRSGNRRDRLMLPRSTKQPSYFGHLARITTNACWKSGTSFPSFGR